jgi:L-amino acid N-acyltransferase YncA
MAEIRDATEADLPTILAITNDAILTSDAIWMDTPQTLDQRRAWMRGRQEAGLPVLVAEQNGAVLGFASYGPFRPYEGYALTVEHSVYVAASSRGRGIGQLLLDSLIWRAEAQGLHAMVAAITAGNEASIALHRRCGFTGETVLPELGRKFGRWLDLLFMVRLLERPSP